MKPFLTFCLIVSLLLGVRPLAAQPPQREVVFHPVNSLGLAVVRPWESRDHQDWRLLGEAKGTLQVPAGMALGLNIRSYMIESIAELRNLRPDDLQLLNLAYCRIPPDTTAIIAHLTGLRHLDLTGVEGLTDEMLAPLGGLRNLETLELRGVSINGTGLAHLAPVTTLRKLNLHITQFNDAGMEALVQIQSLEYVGLWLTYISAGSIPKLALLPKLKSVDFSGTIDNGGCAHLSQITGLQEIRLFDNDVVNDDGLRALSRLPNLKTLLVNSKSVTDEGMMAFAPSPSIERLTLIRSQTTHDGQTEFLKQNPDCVLAR